MPRRIDSSTRTCTGTSHPVPRNVYSIVLLRERLREFFAAVVAGCTRDGYVLRAETERLHQHWRGSALRWISAGHFSALVTQRRTLCDCIADAIAKL
jgi:hypothetical protein